MISQVDPELIAAGVSFLIVLGDALRRYLNDETVRLYQLPWVEFRALFEFGRRKLFTIEKPDHPSIVVDYSIDKLRETLGKQGVKPRHKFSFRYEGEKINSYHYFYDASRKHPHRQIHVRAFEHEDGARVMAHTEPHWYLHPVAHLKSNDMEKEAANKWVRDRLDDPKHVGYPSD